MPLRERCATRLNRNVLTQLQTNEHEQLIARAKYILDQQQLYQEQANLESPSLTQRWEHTRNQEESQGTLS